ncbi:MAG: hypothetical protein ABUK15_07305 [Anaerolineales bacterium]
MALGFREADTEEAANTAEARGRRSVAAAQAGIESAIPQPVAPKLSQPAPQAASQAPAQPQAVDESDPFGSFVDILKNVASFGIRPLVQERVRRDRRAEAAQNWDATITATKQVIDLYGGLDQRDPMVQSRIQEQVDRFDAVVPGGGEGLKETLALYQLEGMAAVESLGEHRDRIISHCGLNANTVECAKKTVADEKVMAQWNTAADEERIPTIMEKFQVMVESASKAGSGQEILQSLAKNGWSLADLRRLPEPFAFTPDELKTISRNEALQNELSDAGFVPPETSAAVQKAGLTEEVTGGTNLAKLQKDRAKAEAAGDTRLASELNKKIAKETTIVGRTEADVRTGLTGATPKDTDELRAGIRNMQGNLEELGKTMEAFASNPEAGGLLGTVLESAGGLLGQIPFIGEDLANMLPGDQEKVKKARTQARFTVASMLTTITKEESGRFTDKERAIAQEAIGALDVTASPPQIQAALETAIEIMNDSQNRKIDELYSASGLDLASPVGLESFNKILIENRFTQDQADEAILDVMERRGIVLE